ncbi:uncharacterized protein BJX67DRAFT_386150 [Aspergillus lucknowensis]|uniref:Secreted protein n=1 Tax=Aspergillus lucknowensis TaxID=176173 RepID=A0ABR4L8Y5_9EURO
MRLCILTPMIAMLATAVSGQQSPTVNCWGKALHPTVEKVDGAIDDLRRVLNHGDPHFPPAVTAPRRSCASVYCYDTVSIRFCNERDQARTMDLRDIYHDVRTIAYGCIEDYNGKQVTGGVRNHPDQWSVVVQADDACKKG